MEALKKINLRDSLEFIEKPVEDKITIFFNSSGQLETFFNYKANVIEVHKEKMKLELGKVKKEEMEETIRSQLVAYLQKGYKIVLFFGSNEKFDILGFFETFSWFNSDLFKNKNYFDKKFLLNSKFLKENEDWDLMNSFKGGYKVDPNARIYFLSGIEENEVDTFMKTNSGIPLQALIVD
jgi:hypothetical protein